MHQRNKTMMNTNQSLNDLQEQIGSVQNQLKFHSGSQRSFFETTAGQNTMNTDPSSAQRLVSPRKGQDVQHEQKAHVTIAASNVPPPPATKVTTINADPYSNFNANVTTQHFSKHRSLKSFDGRINQSHMNSTAFNTAQDHNSAIKDDTKIKTSQKFYQNTIKPELMKQKGIESYKVMANKRKLFSELSAGQKSNANSAAFQRHQRMKSHDQSKRGSFQSEQGVEKNIEEQIIEKIRSLNSIRAETLKNDPVINFQKQRLDRKDVGRFWQREFNKNAAKHIAKEGKQVTIGEYADTQIIEESEILVIMGRFKKIFGHFKNCCEIKKMLKKREGDVVRRFIEENYRSQLTNKVDEFLNMDFNTFHKLMKDDKDSNMPAEQNIYDDKYQFHENVGNNDLLLDNFDHRLDIMGTSIDNVMGSIKHQLGIDAPKDISDDDVFISDLCFRLKISQSELIAQFQQHIIDSTQEKKTARLNEIRQDPEWRKQRGEVIEEQQQPRVSMLAMPVQLTEQDISTITTRRSARLMHSKRVQIFNSQATGRSQTRRSKSEEILEANKLEIKVDEKLLKLRRQLEKKRALVEKAIDDEVKRVTHLKDPTKADDVKDVIEQNLEQLLVQSDVYHDVEVGAKRKQELDEIKGNAQQMIIQMKKQSEAQSKKANTGLIVQGFAGSKIDFLVQKFVNIIKGKARERKDQDLIEQNEKLIGQILKKYAFNSSFKNAEVYTQGCGHQQHFRAKVDDALGYKIKGMMKQKTYEAKLKNSSSLELLEEQFSGRGAKQAESVPILGGLMAKKKNAMMDKLKAKISEGYKDEYQKYQQKIISEDILKKYIQSSMQSGNTPLPILNRIDDKGIMCLVNYKVGDGNAKSFAETLEELVPAKLKKLTLIDNAISDKSLALILNHLTLNQKGGLAHLSIVGNDIGKMTLQAVLEFFKNAPKSGVLKSLHLKNPNPPQNGPMKFSTLFQGLVENVDKLVRIQKLTLSQFAFDQGSLAYLPPIIINAYSLHYLDISANKLTASEITTFINKIDKHQHLRTLKIGYNSSSSAPNDNSLPETISKFIHFSDSILHLDLSGMNFTLPHMKIIFTQGLRKSRTLLSCHLSGLGFNKVEMTQLRTMLKIKDRPPMAMKGVDQQELIKVFQDERKVIDKANVFTDGVYKQNKKNKELASQALRNSPFQFAPSERYIFERVLGHLEMVDNQNWRESTSQYCKMCNKRSYCIFIWNKEVQMSEKGKNFYKSSPFNPIKFNTEYTSNHPLLYVNGKVRKMISAIEFLERQQASETTVKYKERGCNNEKELEKYQDLQDEISAQISRKIAHPTFWKEAKSIIRDGCKDKDHTKTELQKNADTKNLKEDVNKAFTYLITSKNKVFDKVKKIQEWDKYMAYHEEILMHIPKGSYQPVDVRAYRECIQQCYEDKYINNVEFVTGDERNQAMVDMWQKIGDETFMTAVFLPLGSSAMKCKSISNYQVELVIKHPDEAGINYLCIPEIKRTPQNKHFSASKQQIYFKQIKKVKVIRHFHRPASVFCDFFEDDKENLDKAFDFDKQYMKIPKFIKDKGEIYEVMKVLRKYFPQLRDQFNNQIANPKFYPVIGWLDYVNSCRTWEIIDQYLSATDIDRTFIAVNFEEVDLDANDDKSLCRYEFLEITVRLAKIKYYDKKRCKTIAEATERMITEFLLPNSCEIMPWQKWRDKELWQLDIDDLFKANKQCLDQVYQHYLKDGENKSAFELTDANKMMRDIGYQSSQWVNASSIAYSLSKNFILDEMEDFEQYQNLKRGEFYELIGRFAYFIFSAEEYGEQYPLIRKIEQVIQLLLNKTLGCNLCQPVTGKLIESDSDYEDDLVADIIEDVLKEQKEEEE